MKARPRAAEIPPTTDELLAAGQRRVGERRLNLRDLKPAGIDDAESERHVEEITHTYGANAQIAPAKSQRADPVTAVTAPELGLPPLARRPRYASFRVDLPEYLDQELTMCSARERVTKAYLIMNALHRAGFAVKPEDLVADRRKTRFGRSI
jgi:hypothetical protein